MTDVALFCDLDGVIFDSYDLWDDLVETLLAKYGVTYTTAVHHKLWHLSMPEAQAYLQELTGATDPAQLETDKQALLQEAYTSVRLVAGAHDFLETIAEQGIPVFAVTSNQSDLARLGLKNHGLLPYFKQIYSCLDYGHAEKDSQFLQTICQLENLCPEEVVMLEDSPTNLVVARSLGIKGILLDQSLYDTTNQDNILVERLIDSLELIIKKEKT